MEKLNSRLYVYTRATDEYYPAGLANSIHFSFALDSNEKQCLNRNYGILFAKAIVLDDNTLLPLGVRNPQIFVMNDGYIGISAERILESGEAYKPEENKVLFWKTKDLIDFTEEELIEKAALSQYNPSESIEVEDTLILDAQNYYGPITLIETVSPYAAIVKSIDSVDQFDATLKYSDGSERKKKIIWEKDGITLSENLTEVKGHIHQQSFKFPLSKGYGDPVIFHWENKWYFISTNDNLNDIGIYVRESDDVDGLFKEGYEEHLILGFDADRGFEQTFWAPEFHVIGGELYILFAVSGHQWGPQSHMMKLKPGEPIIDADSWEDPVRVIKKDGTPLAMGAITLDMTYFKAGEKSYVSWSYREGIGTHKDTGSMVFIATIDENEPWRLTSDPVLLTRPLYGWENVSGTINNEGPYAFIREGKVFLTYSGGSANGFTYVLGLLSADADKDLLDISNWTKSKNPVLDFYSVKGEYGCGHNSFFVNEDGELMIAYHGETDINSHLRCDGIRRVHFRKDNTPYFKMSQDEDLTDTDVIIRLKK